MHRSCMLFCMALAAGTIGGMVFEDISGDALADGDGLINNSSGDQRFRAGVRVCVFRDNGDDIPNALDSIGYATWATSCRTTSTTSGAFTFGSASNGTYSVVVQSSLLTPAPGGTGVAEQTYGPTAVSAAARHLRARPAPTTAVAQARALMASSGHRQARPARWPRCRLLNMWPAW